MNLRVAIAVLLLLFLIVFTVGAALDERDRPNATGEAIVDAVYDGPAFDGFDCPLHLLVIRETESTGLQAQPFTVPDCDVPPDAYAPDLDPFLRFNWTPEPTSQLSPKEVVI